MLLIITIIINEKCTKHAAQSQACYYRMTTRLSPTVELSRWHESCFLNASRKFDKWKTAHRRRPRLLLGYTTVACPGFHSGWYKFNSHYIFTRLGTGRTCCPVPLRYSTIIGANPCTTLWGSMELARHKGPKSDAQSPGGGVSSPTHQLEGLGSAVNFLQWGAGRAGRSPVRPGDLERFMGLQSRSWRGFTFISVKSDPRTPHGIGAYRYNAWQFWVYKSLYTLLGKPLIHSPTQHGTCYKTSPTDHVTKTLSTYIGVAGGQ